jgi:hypothetical protein
VRKHEGKARTAIAQAKIQLDKGDYDSVHLANYMLRDLEVTKEADLSDLSWAMHRNNLHKNDVIALIEYLEKYLAKVGG